MDIEVSSGTIPFSPALVDFYLFAHIAVTKLLKLLSYCCYLIFPSRVAAVSMFSAEFGKMKHLCRFRQTETEKERVKNDIYLLVFVGDSLVFFVA